jgi:hypothetical protein
MKILRTTTVQSLRLDETKSRKLSMAESKIPDSALLFTELIAIIFNILLTNFNKPLVLA